MSKLLTKAPAKATAAKAAPKLQASTAAKKPGKALATKKAAPAAKAAAYVVGAVAEFVAYATAPESPIFSAGDRIVIVSKEKDADQNVYYGAVKEADYAEYTKDPESVTGDQVYPAEIKKAEKAIVDPYAIDVPHIEELDEVLSANGGDALKAASAIITEMQGQQFLLGGLIGELYKDKSFQGYGDYEDEEVDGKVKKDSGWDKFCQDNLGMGGRKAFGMVSIYRQFASLPGFDFTRLSDKKLGWVKLETMAPVVTADNVEELLAAGLEQNVGDFRETVRTDYVSAGDGSTRNTTASVKRTTLKAVFFEDQAVGVMYVLEQAAKLLGTKPDAYGQILESIIMQWGSTNIGEAQFKKARSLKRSKQKELKGQGVDIEQLKADDAKLEQYLQGATADEEEAAA